MKSFCFALLAVACVFMSLSMTLAASIPREPSTNEKVQEVLAKNPRLNFVGSWEDRLYYFLDTTWKVNQYDAREYCKKIGMTLARFESQAVLTHIGRVLSSSADYAWTDGHIRSDGYVWEGTVEISRDLLLTDNGNVGLTVDRQTASKLKAYASSSTAHYPLCLMTN